MNPTKASSSQFFYYYIIMIEPTFNFSVIATVDDVAVGKRMKWRSVNLWLVQINENLNYY